MVIDSIPSFVGMIYAIIATVIVITLFRKGKFSKRKGYIFLIISTLFGFLVFAPMLPLQLQTVILGNTKQLQVPIVLAIGVLVVFVVLTFIFGRAFCGYVCPIGAVQELIYRLPVKKIRFSNKVIPVALHFILFVTFLVLAIVFSEALLKYLGVKDFFHLSTATSFFYVFLTLLITSAFYYRLFCRFLCPYGMLLSLAAIKSRFKLRRTADCKDCGKCEKACPTNEAAETDQKQECYLCNRCVEACRKNAIVYTRKVQDIGKENGLPESKAANMDD